MAFFPRRRSAEDIAGVHVEAAFRKAGLTPVGETGSSDIFVTGYPKSGNTWFQFMMSILVFGADAHRTPFKMMLEMVPDLSAGTHYRRFAERMIFKSHALPDPKHRRVVYLIRDGRDVMVSYRHYRQIVDQVAYEAEDFVSRQHDLWPCHWADHVAAWDLNPFGADILLIRYEDLVADTKRQLRRFCEFASIDRTDDQIEVAAQTTSFHALKGKERSEGNWHSAFGAKDTFFRRGEVGSHMDELSPEALALLLDHAGLALERHGYLR